MSLPRTILALTLACTTVCVACTPRSDVRLTRHDGALQAKIERALRDRNESTPGAVVLVTRDGAIEAHHAAGMANLEHAAPITLDTVFHVASDAKRFTAAAICRLVERGQLRFDDPVSQHLPEIELGDRITIEQLLTHSSGLRDQWSLLAMAGWQRADLVTHNQVLSLIARQTSTNFTPGQQQAYCNSGYTLAAEIVSRVADVPFHEFVRREFFEPAGMQHTGFRASALSIVPHRAESYVGDPAGHYLRRPVQYEALGATALLTTARDLARWITAVNDGRILSEFERNELLRQRHLPNGDPLTYVFGMFEHDVNGHRAIGHGGADGGFRSYFLRVPDERFGVIVLANTPEVEPNGLAHDIAEWALESVPNHEPEPSTDDDDNEDDTQPPELDALVGTYGGESGRTVTVRPWFDKLRLWEDGARTDFSWDADRGAFVDSTQRAIDCNPQRCRLTTPDGEWTGKRLAEASAAELSAYEGRYRSTELDATYTLTRDGERLVARSNRGTTFELTPAGRDFFGGSAWFTREVRMARGDDGNVRGMYLTSSRAYDVYFARE